MNFQHQSISNKEPAYEISITYLRIDVLSEVPKEHDWRKKFPEHLWPPVRDQSHVCAACWAVTVVNLIQWALLIQMGEQEVTLLSVQAVIDCVWQQQVK